MEPTEYINRDVIDLRDLVQTIKKGKKLIYMIAGAITLLAILYAFVLAKPLYEVKAMIEVGKIAAGTKEETPLDNLADFKQKFEYLHGIHSKKKRAYPRVKVMTIPKKSKSIFALIVESRDNESAITFIEKITHQIENDYAKKIESYIHTQKELILLTESDINVNKQNLHNIDATLKNYNEKILTITKEDAALAGLYTIQISQNQLQAQTLQSRISTLKTKVFNLKLSIEPLRITKTHIVGNVEILDKPIKPKKALIVIVAFITGLMLSIFVVFFLAFLKGLKEEE